ncbi:MAG TPA: metallopeptidase TldD-related protein [Candidatus Acidoferrales bacterium]|nr:metallopeptidase TldD-related protein [Candidatus Acidoferrales bacterium]
MTSQPVIHIRQMWRVLPAIAALVLFVALPVFAQNVQNDNDHTLEAMQDEMARNVARLQLPGQLKPFYIEYRVLDVDVRSVTASFGTLVSSTHTRNRFMAVGLRVGDNQLDSSNFVTQNGFQGFLGSTGQVGIDRDYKSFRQDLWLATDQAYKEALVQYSNKKAFLNSLARPPEIPDFSKVDQPVVDVRPLMNSDWSSRNWENEAREASRSLRSFPDLYGSRVHYYLVYTTYYLLTSEGAKLRISHSVAGIEASLDTQATDGMPLHDFYSSYSALPSELPQPGNVSTALTQTAAQLEALRAAPNVSDYEGPVLFDAPAAGSVLAQALEPSLSGARPPLSSLPAFDQMLQQMGGHSEWSGRVGTRVLPLNVSLTDDPSAKDFQGQPLFGSYDVDDEGVRAQRVNVVENGILKNLLMSRRPGPDFLESNGHARSSLLSPPQPTSSNLFFQATNTLSPADLRKKFIDLCKTNGQRWCLEIKRMDNPALAAQTQQDFSDIISALADGLSSGDRLPLLVYRVYVSDGHEELVRGSHIRGLDLRAFRTIAGIGNDSSVFNFMQNLQQGLGGTALATFGSVQGGIPSSIVAPSLLLEDVEVRGFHGEPRRLPLLPTPALQ